MEIFYSFLLLLNLINSSVFLNMKHPLSMGLMLLIQTVIISLLMGMMMKTFWFSYILFLVFIGGMLVLFIYVTSLASNDLFKFSFKTFIFMFYTAFFIFLFIFFMDKNLIFNYLMNNETFNLISQNKFIFENSLMLNKLYNFPINLISIALMIYLFITLIAIVKITNIFEGPLRPKL